MAGRARPTLRCLREDIRQAVPPAGTPLERTKASRCSCSAVGDVQAEVAEREPRR